MCVCLYIYIYQVLAVDVFHKASYLPSLLFFSPAPAAYVLAHDIDLFEWILTLLMLSFVWIF